jgi:hypothetical protein
MTSISIRSEVLAKIKMHLGSRANNLSLHLRDNALVLEGTVPSYYAKQLAQHLALKLLGSTTFVNEIQVVAPSMCDLDAQPVGP